MITTVKGKSWLFAPAVAPCSAPTAAAAFQSHHISRGRMLTLDIPVVTPEQVLRLPQDPEGARWWLLQTASRRERRLADALAEAGAVPVLVTTIVRVWRTNGYGKRTPDRREVLVFPTYAFANGTAEQIYECRRFQPAQIVPIRQQSKAAKQIARTVELAATVEELTTVPLAPGQRVVVTKGKFAGYEGTVRENKRGLVYFDIEFMGRSIPMEIDPEFVECI